VLGQVEVVRHRVVDLVAEVVRELLELRLLFLLVDRLR
jgi:hypothetical protein